MTEPAAGIFATLFVLLAALMLLRAVRGRFGSRPKTFRVGIAVFGVVELCMAVFTLFMSTPRIFGLPWSVRNPVAGLALFVGIASGFLAMILIAVDPSALAAYARAYLPSGLYHLLVGKRKRRASRAGE